MRRRSAWRGDGEQFLEKAAYLPGSVHEMDLQDPVSRIALGVRLAQELGVARPDGKALRVGGQALMGKVPDEVTRGRRSEFPAGRGGQSRDEVIKLAGGEPGRLFIEFFAALKSHADVT